MMSTPVKSTPVRAAPAPTPDSPGTWRHPRLDEITRRRDATTFSEKNVRRIAYNIAALLGMWSFQLVVRLKIDAQIFPKSFRLYLGWAWFLCQLVPVMQIAIACLLLIRPEDDLSDIPLTTTQRKLLGLDPSVVPPTPDAKFSTPPRYSRTPSIAGSVGSRASYPSSPLSGRGSPVVQGEAYSPIASPLLHKSVGGFANRRSSFGASGGSLGASTSSIYSDPASPSPSGGKRTSVGLNSKWLYEKRRRSSASAWAH